MVRICFLIRQLNEGGAQRQLATLVKGLDRSKFNISVMTLYAGGQFCEEIKRLDHVNYICLEKGGRWDVFPFLFRLIRQARKLNPDLLHSYLCTANCLSMFLKLFMPKTRMIFGVRASNMDLSRYDWLARYVYRLECFLSRFADCIIVNSEAGYEHAVSQGFPRMSMNVVPNGIDIERFKPDRQSGLRMREEWGVGEKEILIGLVGRLDPMKDHPTFLKAASLLVNKIEHVRFVCLGTGPKPYRDELVATGNTLGLSDRIFWMNPRSDMPSVYNAFDIVTSSSSFGEGFPNVIGEAMACGVPCVVTKVGDSSRVVGDTGIVVPPNNPKALAEGWSQILTEDKKQAALQARLRIQNNFSVNQLAQRTEKVLSGTLQLMLT